MTLSKALQSAWETLQAQHDAYMGTDKKCTQEKILASFKMQQECALQQGILSKEELDRHATILRNSNKSGVFHIGVKKSKLLTKALNEQQRIIAVLLPLGKPVDEPRAIREAVNQADLSYHLHYAYALTWISAEYLSNADKETKSRTALRKDLLTSVNLLSRIYTALNTGAKVVKTTGTVFLLGHAAPAPNKAQPDKQGYRATISELCPQQDYLDYSKKENGLTRVMKAWSQYSDRSIQLRSLELVFQKAKSEQDEQKGVKIAYGALLALEYLLVKEKEERKPFFPRRLEQLVMEYKDKLKTSCSKVDIELFKEPQAREAFKTAALEILESGGVLISKYAQSDDEKQEIKDYLNELGLACVASKDAQDGDRNARALAIIARYS